MKDLNGLNAIRSIQRTVGDCQCADDANQEVCMNVTVKEASRDDCVSDDADYKLPILHSWEKQGPLQGRRSCSIVV